jgi:hypothetical protein
MGGWLGVGYTYVRGIVDVWRGAGWSLVKADVHAWKELDLGVGLLICTIQIWLARSSDPEQFEKRSYT